MNVTGNLSSRGLRSFSSPISAMNANFTDAVGGGLLGGSHGHQEDDAGNHAEPGRLNAKLSLVFNLCCLPGNSLPVLSGVSL